MKFLIIHNRYSRVGGEESVVEFQRQLLERRGHRVVVYQRAHDEIQKWPFGRVQSFFTAMYNPQAVKEVERLVREYRPQAAIVHNLFPVISAAVLPVLKRGGVRVLMALHNFRLVCPTGLFYSYGEICERCGGSFRREGNCVERRCEGSLSGSVGFAARSWWSRICGYYLNNVDVYLAQTGFQRDKLAEYGLPKERFRIVPNVVDPAMMPAPTVGLEGGGYVGYAGRLSAEKGVDLLFEVAGMKPQVRFRVAGDFASEELRKRWEGRIPENVELLGLLNKRQLADFYTAAATVIMTSRCYEGFGLTLAEAMYYGTPVIAPDLAGPPELADHGKAGWLYRMGSAEELAGKIDLMLSNKGLAEELGCKGQLRIKEVFNPECYYQALLDALAGVEF